jgi:Glycosyl hydrolase family 26
MLEIGRFAAELARMFGPPGRWMIVKVTVVLFSGAALLRLIPWKPRRTVPERTARTTVALWTSVTVLTVAGVAATSVVATRADQQYDAYALAADTVHAALPATADSYFGVFEPGVPGSYAPVAAFARATQTRPRLALYYSGWNAPFAAGFAKTAYDAGTTTMVQMMPDAVTMASIASGQDDQYLNNYATAVRSFRHPVVIGFAPEMNGNWYSWGYQHTSPGDWVAAWRHVVTVFRADGADNVTWLWTANQVYPGSGPLTQYWPGARYVNWVGIDSYFVPGRHQYASVVDPTLHQIRAITSEPVIISETGIAPGAGKTATLPQLFAGVGEDGLLGFVYFDDNQPEGADYHYDWRLEDDQLATTEYGQLAREQATATRAQAP